MSDFFLHGRERMTAIVVASALFMQTLDATVLGTALPAIAQWYSVDPVELHLAMSAYLLSLAVFTPLSGWVADRYGVRRVFQLAVGVFSLASLLCAIAPSAGALVAARALQGFGGAMMVPVARLALLRTVEKRRLVRAMTWVTVPALLGPSLGPPVGGMLVTYASWHWIFLINLPFGLIGIVLAQRYFEATPSDSVAAFDRHGFILCALASSGLMLGFEAGGSSLLPQALVWFALVLGVSMSLLYVRYAHRASAPVLDVSLLRVPTFAASVYGGTLFRIGIGASPFLMPLLLQTQFGYSALDSGLITLAGGLGALSMKFLVEPILARAGFRRVLMRNAWIAAASMIVCAAFTSATPYWLMFGVLLAGGMSRSLQFSAINTMAYADMNAERMSQATALASTVQQLSLAAGVGFAAMLLDLTASLPPSVLAPSANFSIALLVIALVMGASTFFFATLSDDAGSEVSGNRPALASPPVVKR